MNRTERLSCLALTAAIAAASADALGAVPEAIAQTKPIFDARMRYEEVDQTPLAKDAHASTLRVRAGLETGKAWNTALLIEGEAVTPLEDQYRPDSSRPRNVAYPVVADPESYEVNRLQLTNTYLPGTTLTLGRQRIVLDDQRFISNAPWRQNEQTYDGLRIVNKSVSTLTVDLSYVNQVNRVFGPDSPQGRYRGDVVLGNVAYQHPFGKLTVFGYWLDFEPLTSFPGLTAAQAAALDPVRVSTRTYGIRFSGERPLNELKVGYAASYASQHDYGANPLSFDLDFHALEVTGTYRQFSFVLGQEVMDGNGTVGFSTPLTTFHRFHGWAEKFSTTPADGLDDRYVSAGYAMKKVAMLDTLALSVVYRDFRTQQRDVDLGSEVDVQLQAKYGRVTALLKYADYDAQESVTPLTYQDTTKVWAQLEYAW
jgi:hypothetical protein